MALDSLDDCARLIVAMHLAAAINLPSREHTAVILLCHASIELVIPYNHNLNSACAWIIDFQSSISGMHRITTPRPYVIFDFM